MHARNALLFVGDVHLTEHRAPGMHDVTSRSSTCRVVVQSSIGEAACRRELARRQDWTTPDCRVAPDQAPRRSPVWVVRMD